MNPAEGRAKDADVIVAVTRADGTVQTYGIVTATGFKRRHRAVAALRTWRLNAAARRSNPEVPRTRILPLIRHVFQGDN